MKTSYTWFIIFIFGIGCGSKETSNAPGSVPIQRGTTELTLNITNDADGITIPVVLSLPAQTSQPLKAVVVMHGSGGQWVDQDLNNDGIADVCNSNVLSSQFKEWKQLLNDNQMITAIPDGYSNRGTCENAGDWKNPPLKSKISGTFIRNRDAIAVLTLLKKLVWADTKHKVVDADNIAILGFSDGGTAVISSLYDTHATPANWTWKQIFDGVTYTKEILPPQATPDDKGFKAGVFYYAGAFHNSYYGNLCNAGEGIYKSYCDVLVHLPDDDPLTANALCLLSTMQQNGGGTATVYHYPSTGHSFDSEHAGNYLLARQRTLDFLKTKLGL